MKYVVTAEQMRLHERHIMEEIGIDDVILMERAACFAAKVIREYVYKDERILIVCGPGNNGADGFAVARILTERGYVTDILAVGSAEKYTNLRRKQETILRRELGDAAKERIYEDVSNTKFTATEYAVIVDAILGIGTSRELTGAFKEAVEWMNRSSALKIALDVPTGICSDMGKVLGSAFCADVTVTFGLRKQGLFLGEGKVHAGKVRYDSCGMVYPAMSEKETFLLDKKNIRKLIKRNPNGNKSTFGKLSFISGNETIAGAAILNVCAAFRSGAGYVKLCTHEKNKEPVLAAAPETVLELYGNEPKINGVVSFADVICAGSGLGTDETAKKLMESLAEEMVSADNKIFILDADALNLAASDMQLREKIFSAKANVILTPHVLEFSRLSGIPKETIKMDLVGVAREFAVQHQCVLVLKDAQTVVASPDGKVCISVKGNDGMAVAGSGDVLAGVIAGIAGQIKEPYMAACTGVYIHGWAGDMAAEKFGKHSMLPSDMIHYVKKCMKKLGKEA